MMRFKEVALSNASAEAKIAGLAVLLDKELLRLSEVVLNTKKLQGPQGEQGEQGPKGEQGDRGFDGTNGKDGSDGKDGKDGHEGKDGVGVQDAKIDFDGSLVITLTNGREINAGDVVPEGVADKIKVIKSGGGNSQTVLDAIEEIQATIASYGTIATQNADAVAITGGFINGTTIGAVVPAAGTFTTLIGGGGSANYGQLTGGAATKAVEFKTLGSDTNVALAIRTQGTGAIDLAAGSRGVNISNGGTVTAITVTASGASYNPTGPTVSITAPTTAGGVQAVLAVATMNTSGNPTVVSGGTGYTNGDILTIAGTSATLAVTGVSGGVITSVASNNFLPVALASIPANPASVTGGTGSGATFTILWKPVTLSITNAGSGYVEQPTVTFSDGGGSGAAAYVTVGSNVPVKGLGNSIDFYVPEGIGFRVSGASSSGGAYWMSFAGSTTPIMRAVGSASGILETGSAVPIQFRTNGATSGVEQLRVAHTASAVNYVQVTGAATGGRPTISSQGSDTNIDLALTPKGTGNVRFGTLTASADAAITGYITIKDSGGTVRKLAVIA